MNPAALAALAEAGIVDAAAVGRAAPSVAGIVEGQVAQNSFWQLDIPLPLHQSSCIASATYSVGRSELTLTFHTGAQAKYPDISIATVIGLVKASSPGSFYNLYIKGRA
jgi:hypothetical protein